jgi:hypothetical protein
MSENKVLTDLVLSNSTVHATINAPFDLVDVANGVTFEQAAAGRQEASDAHNHRETPNYANSIGRRAPAFPGKTSQ